MTHRCSTDIVILGGGIAGLWLLNRLRQAGYAALLLESRQLGGGQTVASQGIIHGGLKYALNGSLSGAANAIADMPSRWRRCLQGEGDVDLRGVPLLSQHYYMWSDAGLRSRLKTFLGSKSLRGRVRPVAPDQCPALFEGAPATGTLYALPDFVIDTPALLQCLARPCQQVLFKVDEETLGFEEAAGSDSLQLTCTSASGEPLTIGAQRIICTAGQGNEALIEKAGLTRPRAQRRPLNMVFVKKSGLPDAYLHCIGDDFSLTPRLTVTSHRAVDGDAVWYLGGELAESGVGKTDQEQIAAARAVCARLFPWLNFAGAAWHCFPIDRAEARDSDNFRPDDGFFIAEKNLLVAWPTKLTLAPSLADKILDRIRQDGIVPAQGNGQPQLNKYLGAAPLATPPW